jgi:hypothetical protein
MVYVGDAPRIQRFRAPRRRVGTRDRERWSLLDAGQRAAVASILRYLEARWSMADAAEVLRDWET